MPAAAIGRATEENRDMPRYPSAAATSNNAGSALANALRAGTIKKTVGTLGTLGLQTPATCDLVKQVRSIRGFRSNHRCSTDGTARDPPYAGSSPTPDHGSPLGPPEATSPPAVLPL